MDDRGGEGEGLLVNETRTEHALEDHGGRKVSVDDVMDFIGFGPFQVVAFFLAGIASFSFSLDAALFAFIVKPVEEEWSLTPLQFAVLPSLTGVANIIGGFFYGYLSDTFGRVWPFALCSFNIGIFSLASAFSPNFYTLVALRFGTSLGMTACLSLLYPLLVEFLPIKNRGKTLISLYLVQAITACVTGGLAWWLIPTYKKYGWRYLTLITSVPAFVTLVYRLVFYVESPRFLISKGRYKAARKILDKMARWNGKKLDEYLPQTKEFSELVVTDFTESSGCHNLSQTLRNFLYIFKRFYLRTTLSLLVINITNTGAFWGASLFLPSLLADLTSSSYFIAFMGYLGQIPGIILMLIIVEWRGVGRLNSMRLYTALTIVFLLLFGLYQNEAATPVFTIMIIFSMIPIAALVNAYSSESYPTTFRALALNLFNNVGAFVNIFTPYIGGYSTELFVQRPWLFSLVWVVFYTVQMIATFFLTREPLGMKLQDSNTSPLMYS
jgi:MFS family permease